MQTNLFKDKAIKALSIASNLVRVIDFVVKYSKPIKDFLSGLL